MPLYQFTIKTKGLTFDFNSSELSSLIYHDIFDYPLTFEELIKWESATKLKKNASEVKILSMNGFYFLEGKEGVMLKRLLREKISERKMNLARKYIAVLRLIPTIKMVAVTGALAMGNANEESDIDLMIVTSKGTLWLTRLVTLVVLSFLAVPVRRFGDKNQKDKLCLNVWLDEANLTWSKKDRNVYTAHEICQIVPLVNKDKTYEKFLYKNKWIKDYWPNSVKIENWKLKIRNSTSRIGFLEVIAFKLQYLYMKNKISREVVTPTRALFHPVDWGSVVLSRFSARPA